MSFDSANSTFRGPQTFDPFLNAERHRNHRWMEFPSPEESLNDAGLHSRNGDDFNFSRASDMPGVDDINGSSSIIFPGDLRRTQAYCNSVTYNMIEPYFDLSTTLTPTGYSSDSVNDVEDQLTAYVSNISMDQRISLGAALGYWRDHANMVHAIHMCRVVNLEGIALGHVPNDARSQLGINRCDSGLQGLLMEYRVSAGAIFHDRSWYQRRMNNCWYNLPAFVLSPAFYERRQPRFPRAEFLQ